MKIRTVTNTSDKDMGIVLEEGNTVFLHPGEKMKDVSIRSAQGLPKGAKLEYDLSEVPVVNEGRTRLLD